MDKQKLLNFFENNQRFYNKDVTVNQIIIISLIMFLIVFNVKKFLNVKYLEKEVSQRKIELKNYNENKQSNLEDIMKKISKILCLSNDITEIAIDNNKMEIKGTTNNSNGIYEYIDIVRKLDSNYEPNVDLRNNQDNTYEFKINTLLGAYNEI